MAAIFSQILNMSMTGSVVILLVMLARLILKRSPKIFSYALWSVVLFRLLCPVAFTAPISVLDVVEPEQKETSDNTSIVNYIPATVNTQADFIMVQPEEQQVQVESVTEPEEQLHMTPMHAVALVWSTGMAGMMLYSVVQYLALRRRLVGSVKLNGNIYLADHIDTAFVVGLVQPRIYLPSSVPHKERYFILAHEQHHIRRFDHVMKLLAYLALCIHWFNPLVWVAFVLAGKDMEMSCDEAVIKKLGPEIRADYSASLLRLATHRKILSGMPLAFGEGDTKGRVLNMAKWKKPTKWVVAICVVLCLCIVVVCAFNPEEEIPIEELTRRTSEGPVDTAIGDLCFIYPGGLTSEQRDVDNWSDEDTTRSRRDLPTRRPYSHFFIDNGVDFGGIVDFIVPEDREIQLEEMNLPTEWVGLDYIGGSSSYPYAEMEYTLIKDGKDYIQMYQYTYSGRGYFLWFYTEQGNPAHKEAILNSVELGSFSSTHTKLKRDEIISLGQFNITIPKGYGYHRQEDKILEITKKERFGEQDVIGCVIARPNPNLPMENKADLIRWIESAGVDLSGEGIFSEIADESEYGDVSLKIHNLTGLPPIEEEHYLFIAGDIVYDLWIDPSEMDESTKKSILESIWIKESYNIPLENNTEATIDIPQPTEETESYMPTVDGSDIIIDAELVQYGSLKLLLPTGFAAVEQDGVMFLSNASVEVGGIRSWNSSEFQPSDIVDLRKEESGAPIGYMSGSSAYGDIEYDVFWDGNPDGLNEKHTFFTDGDILYDVWYDQNLISGAEAARFLGTVLLDNESNETDALNQCRSVLETIQSGSYHIAEHKSITAPGSNHKLSAAYFSHNEDWMHITYLNVGNGDMETQHRMKVNGKILYNVESPVKDNIVWSDGDISEPELPWLINHKWDESKVVFKDMHHIPDQKTITVQINEPFYVYPEESKSYIVTFFFDGSGNFLQVTLQAEVIRSNGVWTVEETQSVVSLNPETINGRIQEEYQRLFG